MARHPHFMLVLTLTLAQVAATSAYAAPSSCDGLLCRVRSFFRRGTQTAEAPAAGVEAPRLGEDRGEDPHFGAPGAPSTVERGVLYSAQSAENYGERRAKSWITQQKCLSCHTILPYTLSHFGAGADPEGMQDIRQYIVSRVDNWDTARPWYPGKAAQSQGSELIISTFYLTQTPAEDAAAKARVLKSMHLLSAMQEADGAFPWLDYRLEPFESKGARTYGASLAAISYGQLAAEDRAVFAPQIEKLRTFLHGQWERNDISQLDRLHLAWASSQLDGIASASEIKGALSAIKAKQLSDGGWSINQISPFTKKGATPAARDGASDPYATAYVLYVLKKTGLKDDPGFSSAYEKGVAWLKANQDPSGSWIAPSLNVPSGVNVQYATDYASGFAWAVLKSD